jgi:uncharacterized LabA/DUF88 family protein
VRRKAFKALIQAGPWTFHGFAMRIAVLFDAENINCAMAQRVLSQLAARGEVPIRRAVGDFSSAALSAWIDCARENGIELVLQPSLGKGKNGADIRLTIEAMDIAHDRHIDTVALVTHDRDFAPLALRLRHASLAVLGFAQKEPHASFRAACTRFEVMGMPVAPAAVKKPQAVTGRVLDKSAVTRLKQIAELATRQGPILPASLRQAIGVAEPELPHRLGGKGKFLKTLVAHGIVERVGSGPELLVRAARLKQAS